MGHFAEKKLVQPFPHVSVCNPSNFEQRVRFFQLISWTTLIVYDSDPADVPQYIHPLHNSETFRCVVVLNWLDYLVYQGMRLWCGKPWYGSSTFNYYQALTPFWSSSTPICHLNDFQTPYQFIESPNKMLKVLRFPKKPNKVSFLRR